jgi:hypothetical protein
MGELHRKLSIPNANIPSEPAHSLRTYHKIYHMNFAATLCNLVQIIPFSICLARAAIILYKKVTK